MEGWGRTVEGWGQGREEMGREKTSCKGDFFRVWEYRSSCNKRIQVAYNTKAYVRQTVISI